MKNLLTLITFICIFASMSYAQIVVTEISYNPPEGGTDSLEYIEIYNSGVSAVNMNNYKFTKGVSFTFPDTSLGAGKYLLIVKNTTAFKTVYNKTALGWSTDPVSTSNTLSNSGEIIEISDAANVVVTSLTYAKVAPWPTGNEGTDGNGKSIEICSPLANPNNGANWKASAADLGFQLNGKQVFGTPGSANSVPECAQEPDFTVEVSSNVFTPKDITIDVGKTVRWVNKGGTHNVNGTLATFPSNPAGFGNGAASSTSWTYDFRFTKVGLYDYQCDPHASLGMKGTVTVRDTAAAVSYPVRTISSLTTTNADGAVDSFNVNCTVKGIVYGVNLRPAGLQFTIIDANNNGIGAYSASENFGYTVKEGDEVEIKGAVAQFNGFAQIALADVKKTSSGNSLVTPKVITSFAEPDESSLVTIKNMTFVDPSKWPGTSTSGFTVVMSNGTTNFDVRIDNDIDAFALPIPSGTTFNVTGLLGQFDSSSPFTSGYQLLPRYITDFVSVSGVYESELDPNVSVYPNPVTQLVTIVTSTTPDYISLYDAKGNLISSQKNSLTIDMSEFSAGLYFIRLVKGKKTSTIRIAKM